MSDPAVRPAMQGDVEALGRLGALLVQAHHQFDPLRFFAPAADTARSYADFLESQLARRDVLILVLEENERVLGYAFAGVEGTDYMVLRGPAGVLYDLIVDPAHRGNGLGSILLRAVLDALTARGTPRIVLSAAQQNVAAQRLFARHGFRPTMVEMTREAE
jgi:ribosomal protein S18 acetylase RimI-like enzyme